MIWKFLTLFFFLVCIILISVIINDRSLQENPSSVSSFSSPSISRELTLVSTKDITNVLPVYSYDRSQEGLIELANDSMKYIRSTKIGGVAVYFFFNSPKWFQRRYTFIIENALNNIPRDWVVQVFLTDQMNTLSAFEINPGLFKHIESGRLVLTLIPKAVYGKAPRKVLLLSHRWIWENMLAEKIFLILGGVVCSNSQFSLKNFLHFDYIGAPIDKHSFGGDGDFSIRSRSLMLKAFDHNAVNGVTLENSPDFNINHLLKDMKTKDPEYFTYNIATFEDSTNFATSQSYANTTVLIKETTTPFIPWGAISTIPNLSNENREYFLLFCPELKVIFPSLHNPGCFGANPNPTTCSESICAIKFNGSRGC